MSAATKAFKFINEKIDAGMTIMIATHIKVTQVSPKTFAKFEAANFPLFKMSNNGELMMAEGSKYVCIATPTHILVRVSAHTN